MIAEEKDDSKQTPSKVTQHVIKAVTFAQSMRSIRMLNRRGGEI